MPGTGAAAGIKKKAVLAARQGPDHLGQGESIASPRGCLQSPVAGVLFISP